MSLFEYTTLTGPITLLLDLSYNVYQLNALGGSIALTLPNASQFNQRNVTFIRTDATAANVVTITGTGGQLVAGVGTYNLLPGSYLQVLAVTTPATGWARTGDDRPSNGGGALNWGNVAIVDNANGNNATGAVNGPPFLNISNALTAANAFGSPPVTVFVLPGNYTESPLTINAGVTLRGMSQQTVIIGINTGGAVDGVTLNNSSVSLLGIQDVTLSVVGVGNNKTRGIVLAGSTITLTALISNVSVSVTNPSATTALLAGIHNTGTGASAPILNGYQCLRFTDITVINTNAGAVTPQTAGILCDSASANVMNAARCNILVKTSSSATAALGSAYCIGAQVNNSTQSLSLATSTVQATGAGTVSAGTAAFADVSKGTGTLFLGGTTLVTSTANGLSFSTAITPSTIVYGSATTPPVGTSFFYIGLSTPSTSKIQTRIPVQCLCRSISVNARLNTGTRTDTFTVQNNNVVGNTTVTTFLTGGGGNSTANANDGASITFAQGDLISLQDNAVGAGPGPSDVEVILEMY